jgi:hypothetical protein
VAANRHPDHDTIASFRRENVLAIGESFLQVLLLAKELKLLKLGVVSADGGKIDANASKRRSVTYRRAGELGSVDVSSCADDGGAPFDHVLDDPIGVERLVGDRSAKAQPVDQGGDADRVVTLAWQQDEPDQTAQPIGQRQDLGGQAAPRLAYGLSFSPPFAPWPCR